MIEIAKRLNATVQGDEAEIYIAPDNVIRKGGFKRQVQQYKNQP